MWFTRLRISLKRSALHPNGRADRAGSGHRPDRPGISVKLSALHPRFEAVSRERVMQQLVPRLIDLARRAKADDLNFTVDAEEADRLELSLEVIAAAFSDASWFASMSALAAFDQRSTKSGFTASASAKAGGCAGASAE